MDYFFSISVVKSSADISIGRYIYIQGANGWVVTCQKKHVGEFILKGYKIMWLKVIGNFSSEEIE